MKITKEDSPLDTITSKVSGNLGEIQITFKEQKKEYGAQQRIANSLIDVAAKESGITLHDLEIKPIVLKTKDAICYRKLADLLYKYNYISPYDRKQVEKDVNAVEAMKPKETFSSSRKKEQTLPRAEATTNLIGGFSGDLLSVLAPYTPKATSGLIQNSLFSSTATAVPSAPPVPSKDIPRELLCPITERLMSDPVIFISDQWTYERDAIESLLKKGEVSPISGVGLDPGAPLDKVLIPNWGLKAAIATFKNQNPELFNYNTTTMNL